MTLRKFINSYENRAGWSLVSYYHAYKRIPISLVNENHLFGRRLLSVVLSVNKRIRLYLDIIVPEFINACVNTHDNTVLIRTSITISHLLQLSVVVVIFVEFSLEYSAQKGSYRHRKVVHLLIPVI